MIIVGLLGMHTFSADVAGHDAHHSATASTAPEHSTPMAATSDISGAIACDDTCLMGTGQSHSDMVTACVLALIELFFCWFARCFWSISARPCGRWRRLCGCGL